MRAFVIASGPSVTPEDLTVVKRQPGLKIAVNSSIFSAPWADICFAMDQGWWKVYHEQVKRLTCERWSSSSNAGQYGVQRVKRNRKNSPIKDGVSGSNSGLQACEFAYLRGADEIILLGVDCKVHEGRAHHHPDHPAPMTNAKNTRNWGSDWACALKRMDARVINTSPICELECFEYADLRTACEHNPD